VEENAEEIYMTQKKELLQVSDDTFALFWGYISLRNLKELLQMSDDTYGLF